MRPRALVAATLAAGLLLSPLGSAASSASEPRAEAARYVTAAARWDLSTKTRERSLTVIAMRQLTVSARAAQRTRVYAFTVSCTKSRLRRMCVFGDLWRRVPDDSFEIDPALRSATLEFSHAGQRHLVRWAATDERPVAGASQGVWEIGAGASAGAARSASATGKAMGWRLPSSAEAGLADIVWAGAFTAEDAPALLEEVTAR